MTTVEEDRADELAAPEVAAAATATAEEEEEEEEEERIPFLVSFASESMFVSILFREEKKLDVFSVWVQNRKIIIETTNSVGQSARENGGGQGKGSTTRSSLVTRALLLKLTYDPHFKMKIMIEYKVHAINYFYQGRIVIAVVL